MLSGMPRGRFKLPSLMAVKILITLTVLAHLIWASCCMAELLDRVVAYVDDHAITYSEFNERFEKLKEVVPGITEEEAVNSMINTYLLLQQARRMRLEAASDDDLVKEYIDISVKSRVFIKEETLMNYYETHKADFGGKDYPAVRDQIEKYLTELETNKKLKEHIEELRKKANIVIQLKYK